MRGVELRRAAHWAARRVLIPAAIAYRRTIVRRVRVVAVVGSYGKTTTARAVGAVLDVDGSRRHPSGKVLSLRRRHRHGVIEVGIERPGQMAPHARIVRPDVVVVTSIGSEHSKLHKPGVTRTEKAEMVRALTPQGLAVLNGDDPDVMWMATQTSARVMTFGLDPAHDVWAGDVDARSVDGTRFVLHVGGESRPVRLRLLGRHMVNAALAAVAVATAEGVDLDRAVAAVEALDAAPGRLQPRRLPSGALLLLDHRKSQLETVDAALDVLAVLDARRRIIVLGDVDEPPGRTVAEVTEMYARLGGRIAAIADRAVVVHVDIGGPRPDYTEGALAGGLTVERAATVHDAIAALEDDLRDGDVVLVKGAGQQRLLRIELALAGREVRCNLTVCHAHVTCDLCPMLAR